MLAINPTDRGVWLLENVLVFIVFFVLVWSYYRFRLSNYSYFLIFIFGVLHIIGAHFSYAATPLGDWFSSIFDWERNGYDRIVHFLYGLLMVGILGDVLKAHLPKGGFWKGFMIFSVVLAIGALYEILEFVAGVFVESVIARDFLAFQGDVWDTHKDLALEVTGALIGLFTFKNKQKTRH